MKRKVNVFKSFRRKLEDAMAQQMQGLSHRLKTYSENENRSRASRVTRPRCLSLTEGPKTTPTNRTGFIWAWHGPSRCFIHRERPRYHNGYYMLGPSGSPSKQLLFSL